jgi:UDP-GlcNAc:undecaprenyl-phosphate/decaprenyl-phosphate GlcNAc-1-phosphate transferase
MSGLFDDVRGLHPVIQLVAQIIAGLLLVRAGWTIPLSGNTAVDATSTCLYVVPFINAFNFLDGADGIAAGVAAIIAIGYIAPPNLLASALGHAVAWSLLGACFGFLFFNFPPAKLFMGSGSSMLGFTIAVLGLAACRDAGPGKSALTPVLFSVLVASLPVTDAGLAVLRRIHSRASPLNGDRCHIYDLLRAHGYTARHVALICYAMTVILVIAGWFIVRLGPWEAFVTSALVGCALFAIEVRAGALRSQDNSRNERFEEDLHWREMANGGVREKV